MRQVALLSPKFTKKMTDKESEIIETFNLMPDWMDRYEYIIENADALPLIDSSKRTSSYLIEGCQSRVWIDAELIDGKMHITADSDAIIVKGIAALLVEVLTGRSAKDILDDKLEFLEQIGLRDNLSPTRANGLQAMVAKIKLFATAFNEIGG